MGPDRKEPAGVVSERGWRGRLIPVPRQGGEPAFLTIRAGGPFSWFSVTGVIDTPELSSQDAKIGLSTHGSKALPFIVPAEFTHVLVKRSGSGSSGLARWYLDTLPQDRIGALASTGETRGTGPALLRWEGPRRAFAFTLNGPENWSWIQVTDRRGRPVAAEREGDLRGRITLSAPGHVMVRSDGPWSLRSL